MRGRAPYQKQQPNFYVVIKLHARKIFTRSTMNADARSVSGR